MTAEGKRDLGPQWSGDNTEKYLGIFCWDINSDILSLTDYLVNITGSGSGSVFLVSADDSEWRHVERFSPVIIICRAQTSLSSLKTFLDFCSCTHGPENMIMVITDLEDTESEKRKNAEWKEGQYPRCPLLTLTEAEMDVISESDGDDVSIEGRMTRKVNQMRDILQVDAGTSQSIIQLLWTYRSKPAIGIFSREAESLYSWLVDVLTSDLFMDHIPEVRTCSVRDGGFQQFCEDVFRCTFGILYYSKNSEGINVTDVEGSLYDEELKYLSSRLGQEKVIVVIDDVSDSSDTKKTKILNDQPSIRKYARDVFLISPEEKTSNYQRRLLVDRKQLRRKLQTLREMLQRKPDQCKKVQATEPKKKLESILEILTGRDVHNVLQGFAVNLNAVWLLWNNHKVGIFSRSSESDYEWLKNKLESGSFKKVVANVRSYSIHNDGVPQFRKDVSQCTFGILYHTKNRGRINITNVNDSLYDEELEYMSKTLGKNNVIVIVDDVSDDSDQEKMRILQNQPRIKEKAQGLFLFTSEDHLTAP